MRQRFLLFLFICCSFSSFAQPWHIGVFGGISSYQGDLVGKLYNKNAIRPAGGVTVHYEFSERFSARGALTFGKVTGDDAYNSKDYLQARNLSFTSGISELSVVGEYSIFNINSIRWTPYAFAGLAIYRFNPYVLDSANEKIFLKPLSTEGQGLPSQPERRPYSLTQLAIPFGGGVKYAVTDNFRVGFEVGLRKLFTDYLDDVSTDYPDAAELLAERGPVAVEYSYRGDEFPGGNQAFPDKQQRGGADQKDFYYFTGITLSFRLGGGYGTTFASKNGRKGLACPKITF